MLSALLSHPRRLLATLAVLLAATGVAVGSGATFTSQSANPQNTFTSGTLLQTNSKAGAAIVTGSNLKPGDTRIGEVTIRNTGSLAGTFTLVSKNVASTFTRGVLTVKVEDITAPAAPRTLYSGDFVSIETAAMPLGTFAVNEAHTYRFTVTLAQDAGNVDQAKQATADLEWNATT